MVPTVPRPGRNDYLLEALASLEPQLLDASVGETVVLVMNSKPGEHRNFELARERYGPGGARADLADRFFFRENPRVHKDPRPDSPAPDPNPRDIPGPMARRQTLDVCGLYDFAHGMADFTIMMEDDVTLCANGIKAIHYAINKFEALTKAARKEPFTVLRMSYGMNGLVIRDEDVITFRDFMLLNLFLNPPDLLQIEWEAGKHGSTVGTRPYGVYRRNIFIHLGKVSNFEGRPERGTPGCYVDYTSALWPNEQPDQSCNDVSPCYGKTDLPVLQFW